ELSAGGPNRRARSGGSLRLAGGGVVTRPHRWRGPLPPSGRGGRTSGRRTRRQPSWLNDVLGDKEMVTMDASQPEKPAGTTSAIAVRLLLFFRSRKWLFRGLSVCLWLACLLGMWHLTPVTPRAVLWGEKEPHLRAFSPDGNTLVTTAGPTDSSSDDLGPIHLWDVLSGRERATLADERSSIGECQFSPDGNMVAGENCRSPA